MACQYADLPVVHITQRYYQFPALLFVLEEIRKLMVDVAFSAFCDYSEGQLGLGDCENRLYPALCKTLRSQQVVEVVCGSQHTAALTKVRCCDAVMLIFT